MTVIVTGADGQDGTLLTRLLVERGETVLGIGRGGPIDITDPHAVARLVAELRPSRVYLLAAVQHSAQDPPMAAHELAHAAHRVNTLQVHNFAEAVSHHSPDTRIFYAASAHIYGSAIDSGAGIAVRDEDSPIQPRSVYALTKAAGLLACRIHRARGVYAAAGILFNHESPLRPEKFVSRKIVRAVAAIVRGTADELVVGRLDAGADWGYAPDYVRAMSAVLDLDEPEDFVVATGVHHTVADFCAEAFGAVGLDWTRYVREEPTLLTRREPAMVGNARRLRERTGWAPTVNFREMVRLMLAAEGVEPTREPNAPTTRPMPVRAGRTEGNT